MGKSLGNVLDPVALTQAYGPDAVRYYFLRSVDFGTDGDFSEDRFRDQVNAVLANDVGNLLNRSLSLLKKSAGGAFPISAMEVGEEAPLRAMAEDVREKVRGGVGGGGGSEGGCKREGRGVRGAHGEGG